ncbi:MAG TPA: GntR family transcriptional regulator [Solirubrobacteraceae bacterium]|nr:GntR family transcriptional regulator [Solirubrobacteraceae bacterium]
MEQGTVRQSLVDETEQALRTWLARGAHRPGDRLPPELELAGMLGVSRGTLRTALDRLEEAGEITRRQGSGTYVGHAMRPVAFHEGLEVLRPYSELAGRRGVVLTVRDLEIARRRIGAETAAAFAMSPDDEACTITRVVLADGEPVALMRDVVRPGVTLPAAGDLHRMLEDGRMVLDVLLGIGVPVAFAVTRVKPKLITGRDRVGRALGVDGTMAVLELEEVMHLPDGEVVQHSSDVFAPGGIDLQVRRDLEVAAPAPLVRAVGRSAG